MHLTASDSALDNRHRSKVFLVICLILVYGAYNVRQYKPYTFAVYDPGWFVSTVMSIAEDHDLDLRNQLKNDPSQAADQTAQGKHGEWYPLHEIVMPIATLPLFFAFGINGCLIFNIMISIFLMILIFLLCEHFADTYSAFASTALTAFVSLFINYTYSYSLDVFSTFLLLLAFLGAVRRMYLLSGCVWGLSVFARFSNIVTILAFLLYIFLASVLDTSHKPIHWQGISRGKALLKYLIGALPWGGCFLLTNWAMFGSPMITSYDRWQHFVNGNAIVSSQRNAFSCSILDNLPKVLLDPQSGLFVGAPLLILALAFGMRGFWQKARNEAAFFIVISASLLLLFSAYCNAMPGIPGNRYLMPVVALSAIPFSFALKKCFGTPLLAMHHDGD
jgi:hypothetical protein